MADGGSGVALVGFMGSGKTTVGRLLARRLAWPFVDLDEVLVLRHGPIAQQIDRDGLEAFRDRERAEALRWCEGGPRVLATGGGTFVDPEARQALRAAYRTVHLNVRFEVIAKRIGEGEGRPLWDGGVARLYEVRRTVYSLAEVWLEVSDLRPDEVVEVIMRTLY